MSAFALFAENVYDQMEKDRLSSETSEGKALVVCFQYTAHCPDFIKRHFQRVDDSVSVLLTAVSTLSNSSTYKAAMKRSDFLVILAVKYSLCCGGQKLLRMLICQDD